MDDFRDVSHISSPFLYVFEGELIRINSFIKEIVQQPNVVSGYGRLYGFYTYSHSGVLHVATLKKYQDEIQLQHILSNRQKAKENEYHLGFIGEWIMVKTDLNISLKALLFRRAHTLNESETLFFIIAKLQTKFNTYNNIRAFYLTKGNVYETDVKILGRESPFRFDTDFCEAISSDVSEVVLMQNNLNRDEEPYLGTELKDLRSNKSQALQQDGKPHIEKSPELNDVEIPGIQNESENKESGNKKEECDTKINTEVLKTDSDIPVNEGFVKATFIAVEENSKAKNNELGDQHRGEISSEDQDSWVNIEPNDACKKEGRVCEGVTKDNGGDISTLIEENRMNCSSSDNSKLTELEGNNVENNDELEPVSDRQEASGPLSVDDIHVDMCETSTDETRENSKLAGVEGSIMESNDIKAEPMADRQEASGTDDPLSVDNNHVDKVENEQNIVEKSHEDDTVESVVNEPKNVTQ